MTNTQHLVGNLEAVAALDKAIWAAYRSGLSKNLPPLFNPFRALSKQLELQKAGYLEWWQNYYILWVVAIVFGVSSLFTSPWFLVIYVSLLVASNNCRSKYVEAYSRVEIGRFGVSKHAFGLRMPSLTISGVMDALKIENVKIDKDLLDCVIKLNKASQEFEDVAFGVADAARKALIGAPYALAFWIFTTTVPVAQHVGQAANFLLQRPTLLGATMVVLSAFALLAYQFAFSSVVTKRDRKRYLLILNLLRESYQDKRK